MSSFLLFICVAERKPLLQTSAKEKKTKKVQEEGQDMSQMDVIAGCMDVISAATHKPTTVFPSYSPPIRCSATVLILSFTENTFSCKMRVTKAHRTTP